nr:MAG TPA: hypothetical protein [Caudoviricetes sp.]
MTEEKQEYTESEKQIIEMIEKAEKETVENLKDDEALLFDSCGYYTIPKKELDEVVAIVSYEPTKESLFVLFSEYDDEVIENFLTKLGEKAPSGTFLIKFWGKDERTSYEYDEWDFITSDNYEIEKYSDLNFEATLNLFKKYKEAIKNIKELAQRQCTAYDNNDFVSIDTINSQMCDEIREVEKYGG